MNYLYTKYIFPLENEIILSKGLNYVLDNPRTEDEIKSTHKLVTLSLLNDKVHSKNIFFDSQMEQVRLLKDYLQGINDYCRLMNKSYLDHIEYLSHNWIILRYRCDNPEELNKRQLKKKKEVESRGRTYMPFTNKKEEVIKELESYFNIMSLLMEKENFSFIESFILKKYYIQENQSNERSFFSSILFRHAVAHSRYAKPGVFAREYTFDEISEDLMKIASYIDQIISRESNKFFYIGELLDIVNNQNSDSLIQFTTLVSIIEMLVTHSPDYSRYNVEDSISKQFILKSALLIYKHNKEEPLNDLRNNLKTIYNIRSKIAHGDLIALNELFEKISDEEDLRYYLFLWVVKLSKYVQMLLAAYLEDPEYVNFIKNN